MSVPQAVRRLTRALAVVLPALVWHFTVVDAFQPPAVTFLAPVAVDMGEPDPKDLERADFDLDGTLDVAILTWGNGPQIQLLNGNGAGGFSKGSTLAAAFGSGIGTGDFNEDGRLDLAITQRSMTSADSNPYCGPAPGLPGTMIFLGTAGAPRFTFSRCVGTFTRSMNFTDVATGDFNTDGHVDLAVADDTGFGLRFFPGHGDGSFGTPIRVVSAAGTAYSAINPAPAVHGPMATRDVDQDGDPDVVARVGGGVGTFLNDGAGHLRYFATTVPTGGGPILAMAFGDMNGDGVMDIAGATGGGVFVATGVLGAAGANLTYTNTASVATGAGVVHSVALSDLNKDGTPDLIVARDVADAGQDSVLVYAGTGTGTLATTPTVVPIGPFNRGTVDAPVWVPVNPRLVTVGDWNGDNWLDLAVADSQMDNPRTWFLQQVPGVGDATPPEVSLTAPAPGSTVRGAVTLEAAATDADGVARVEFYRGAVLVGAATTSPFRVTWDTTLAGNGGYALTAKAVDAIDNAAASAVVAVTVANLMAVADTFASTEDTPVTYQAAQLLSNDIIPVPGAALAIASVASGAGGIAVLNDTGTVTFTPALNFNGPANFTYTATDGTFTSKTATVTVHVAPVNDPPAAANDLDATDLDTPLTILASDLLLNDSDPDVDTTLAIADVTSGVGGTAAFDEVDQVVTFTPSSNFTGQGTFTYAVTDGTLTSNIATVTVTVSATGEAPAITTAPVSQTIASGTTATLSMVATGTAPLAYQWYEGATAVPGATGSTFTTPALTSATSYWVQITNAFGTAESGTATIATGEVPAMTTAPASQTIASGSTATLSVVATGTAPLEIGRASGRERV